MDRAQKYYLAPASDPTDEYAAGYEGNVFDSHTEAERAIPGLARVLDSEPSDWVVSQYPVGYRTAR